MSHIVLKNTVDEISNSSFICIIADSTTNISGEEQFSFEVIVLMVRPIHQVSGMVYRNTSLKNFLNAVLYIVQTMLLISLCKELQENRMECAML
ncbi:hypothetical protein PR048_001127 [Dryococelus australis]|uniref:Uncharacterized protein n=1 Tax=Dryococelus australis TaxID=614101 RepID=A0ABQ9IGG7_9NEOP|nr:hypothetical protein PR048_001127 [Dryococelus australis]